MLYVQQVIPMGEHESPEGQITMNYELIQGHVRTEGERVEQATEFV